MLALFLNSSEQSLDFGLLVGQKKQFEDVIFDCGKLMSIFHIFSHFVD